MSNIDNIKKYTVIDLEMTGLSAKNDKIIEIGAARVRGGEIVDTISTLVNPKQHIPQRVQELTGITDSDVENAADMDEAVDNLSAVQSSVYLSFLFFSRVSWHLVLVKVSR